MSTTPTPVPNGANPVPETENLPEANRMANLGMVISLKKLGRNVTVKELSMESVIKCAGELAQLLAVIDFEGNNQAATILTVMLQSEPTARAARMFAAESTETFPEDWVEVPITDWLRFVKAARIVHDWEEMRELFMELGLTNLIQGFRARTTVSPAPIPSPELETPPQS